MPNATINQKIQPLATRITLQHALLTLLILLLCNQGLAQDKQGPEPNEPADSLPIGQTSIDTLEKIQHDYQEHLKKRDRIQEQYKNVQDTFKQTEEDLQRINSDTVRNQLLAIQSNLQSQQIVSTLNDIPNQQNDLRKLPYGNTSRTRLEIGRFQNRLVKGKANYDFNTAIKQEELRQLDAASQVIVKRRLECIENNFNLQNEWIVWQQDWQKFMELYWTYTDPERKCNRSELQARLKVLKQSSPEDYPAMLAMAMLHERLGQNNEGIAQADHVLAAATALDSTALYTKSLMLYTLKKDKEAKTAYQNAFKIDSKSPQNYWIRAMIATSREQWGSAETELKPLLEIKSWELETRRLLALIHCARSSNSPTGGAKGLKEATLAFDLEPKHDWFSYFVLSVAHYSNGNAQQSLKQLEKAEENATDEELASCKLLRDTIQANQPFKWNFQRGCLGLSQANQQ